MGFGAWKVGRQEREELETSSLKLLHDALVLFLSCQVFKVGSSSRQHIYHFFRDMVHGCLLSWSLALNKCILCLTTVLLIAMCSFRWVLYHWLPLFPGLSSVLLSSCPLGQDLRAAIPHHTPKGSWVLYSARTGLFLPSIGAHLLQWLISSFAAWISWAGVIHHSVMLSECRRDKAASLGPLWSLSPGTWGERQAPTLPTCLHLRWRGNSKLLYQHSPKKCSKILSPNVHTPCLFISLMWGRHF